MDKDSRFAFLVIGLPFIGLIYCLGIIVFFSGVAHRPKSPFNNRHYSRYRSIFDRSFYLD